MFGISFGWVCVLMVCEFAFGVLVWGGFGLRWSCVLDGLIVRLLLGVCLWDGVGGAL